MGDKSASPPEAQAVTGVDPDATAKAAAEAEAKAKAEAEAKAKKAADKKARAAKAAATKKAKAEKEALAAAKIKAAEDEIKAEEAKAMEILTAERKSYNTRRGQVDIWPIMAGDAKQLAAEIAEGEHDSYLFDVHHAEKSGQRRPAVLSACSARAERLEG